MKARVTARFIAAGIGVGALLLLPGGAAAAGPAPRHTPPSIDQEIGEQGSNGFYVTVKVHDRHTLELSATKLGRDLAIETASYKVPYRSPRHPDEIEARFGKLGRVDMRFDPEKVKEVAVPGSACTGGKITEEEGFWVGVLAFHGELGFTQVRVRSALGTVVKVPPLHCRREKPANLKKLKRELEKLKREHEEQATEESEGGEEETQAFQLAATARRHRVFLVANRIAFGKGKKRSSLSNLAVGGSRRRGRIVEGNSVLDIFAPGSYLRPANSREPTAEATVEPPAPFTGSATYRNPPKGPTTWTGDLKVELPGFGEVRLAGRGTRAAMCESVIGKCGGLGPRASWLLDRLPR